MPSADSAPLTSWRDASELASAALAGGPAGVMKALTSIGKAGLEWPERASVHVLRNFTVEPLQSYLRLAGFRRGVDVATELAGYDTAELDLHDPGSALRGSSPDLVVLALWLDELRPAHDASPGLNVAAAADYVAGLVKLLLAHTDGAVAVNTFLPTMTGLRMVDDEPVARLNQEIRELAAGDGRVYLTDLAGLALAIGLDEAVDRRFLLSSKAPARPALHRAWATDLAQTIASLKGRAKKVLVLDCDNTIWGGIVGEDGPTGIALDPNENPGRAYYAFQRQLLSLHQRGVLLALCSRNNEADVLKVIDDHPHCLLRREHLAGWQVNWNDKVANLEALASTLNVGLDSFVFVDDSPTECERVHRALPMVEVLSAGPEPARLLDLLNEYDGWPRQPVTAEDLARTAAYRAERERTEAAQSFESLGDFLLSLELAATVASVAGGDEVVGRVAQLTNRTNQFTSTTRRYGPGDIQRFCDDADGYVLTLHAEDRFGDHGITGAAIVVRDGDKARVDSFLLSCRVLGRGLELAFLVATARAAFERWDVASVDFDFVPSDRNQQVLDFFGGSGLVAEPGDGAPARYAADRAWAEQPAPAHIRLVTALG